MQLLQKLLFANQSIEQLLEQMLTLTSSLGQSMKSTLGAETFGSMSSRETQQPLHCCNTQSQVGLWLSARLQVAALLSE